MCHSSSEDPVKERGLTLRKSGRTKRSKDLHRIFGESPPRNISPTSPIIPPRPSESDHETDIDIPRVHESPSQNARAIKRASTISVLSGLGVRDLEKALDPSLSPTQGQPRIPLPSANAGKKPSKLRNFFGQRPPSELITTHLTEYFPSAERKVLRTARHSMMLRASTVTGDKRYSTISLNPPLPSRFSTSTQGSGSVKYSASPVQTKRNSVMSTTSTIPDTRSLAAPSAIEDPPRVSISTEDGHSVTLTGDEVEKLSSSDSKLQLLPPVTFPTMSLSESMEDLTGSFRTSRTNSNASKRMSFMTELRSKRDRSDTASLLTVDEITAEVENRRQSMAVDMGVEGAEDWTKVEPDIDDVTSLSGDDTVFEDDDDDDEDESKSVEEEDETGQAMDSSGGKPKAYDVYTITKQKIHILGKWIKGALIGAGSFGKVYLGMDAVNGLLMAVKQVELPRGSAPNEERKKNMLSALEREIDLLKDLSHPNIVQYLCESAAPRLF